MVFENIELEPPQVSDASGLSAFIRSQVSLPDQGVETDVDTFDAK